MSWRVALILLALAAILAAILLSYITRPRQRPMASWDQARKVYESEKKFRE